MKRKPIEQFVPVRVELPPHNRVAECTNAVEALLEKHYPDDKVKGLRVFRIILEAVGESVMDDMYVEDTYEE